jgi:hypothetical protein
MAGKPAGGDFPMRQALFGEEHQGDHDQRHVMMPGLSALGLIVGQPQVPLASSKARSTKWRSACMLASRRNEPWGLTLAKQNLSLRPSISRRTSKCQQRAVGALPFQTWTRWVRYSAITSPFSPGRTDNRRQALSGWTRAQSVTVWAAVCAHKILGALPRGEVRSGMAGCGFSR